MPEIRPSQVELGQLAFDEIDIFAVAIDRRGFADAVDAVRA
jgi:hypothetical protein